MTKCAMDGTVKQLPDRRCAACGHIRKSAKAMVRRMVRKHAFEMIVAAAEEGYRNTESDAKNGVPGAAWSLKKYGDAFSKIDEIRSALNEWKGHES